MIRDRDLELVLVEFLAPVDDRLDEAVRDAALDLAWRERRRVRRPWDRALRGPRSIEPGWRLAVLLAALLVTALTVALLGGGLRGRRSHDPPLPLEPGAVRGLWLGLPLQPGAGAWRLRFSDFATLEGPGSEFQILSGYRIHDDRLEVPAGIGDCVGAAGTYRAAVEGDRLVLDRVVDACASRADALLRHRWLHVPEGDGVAHRFQVPFTYPDLGPKAALEETTTTLQGFGGATVNDPNGLVVWIISNAFEQACRGDGEFADPRPLEPGAEALAARLEAMPDLDVQRLGSTSAAGRTALHVRLRVDPERCGHYTARLWEDVGTGVAKGGDGEFFELAPGGEADLFILDVGGTTITLVAWDAAARPITAERRQLIDGIRFITP